MAAIVLGLLGALAYGGSDFLAGLVSRRRHFAAVAVVGQFVAVLAVLLAVPFAGGTPSPGALGWGALGGVGSGLGSLALYRGLARGRMNVVGPLSGVVATALPVIVGLASGERPSWLALLGVVVALPAVWLVSTSGTPEDPVEVTAAATPGGTTTGPAPRPGRRRLASGAVDGVLAGLGFGVLFVALAQAPDGGGLWPAAATNGVSVLLVAVTWLVLHRRPAAVSVRLRDTGWQAIVAGLLGATATVAYLLATRHGLLVVVAVLVALYPAATVLLARIFLRERTSPLQRVGLGLAAAGVVAITLG